MKKSRTPLQDKIRSATRYSPMSHFGETNGNYIPSRAKQITARAKRLGILVPQPCEHCGFKEPVVAHHSNYFLPLDVTWLCHPCHMKEHGRLIRAKILILGQPMPARILRSSPDTTDIAPAEEAEAA